MHFVNRSNFLSVLDVDECALNISDCQQGCRNTIGGYECFCFDSYKVVASNPSECEGKSCNVFLPRVYSNNIIQNIKSNFVDLPNKICQNWVFYFSPDRRHNTFQFDISKTCVRNETYNDNLSMEGGCQDFVLFYRTEKWGIIQGERVPPPPPLGRELNVVNPLDTKWGNIWP